MFQIWAKHIYLRGDNTELTLAYLMEIFPEFEARLNIYSLCCNEKGQIVRNKEQYEAYKASEHESGKRGGGLIIIKGEKA